MCVNLTSICSSFLVQKGKELVLFFIMKKYGLGFFFSLFFPIKQRLNRDGWMLLTCN
ncbi:hypothetical protein HanIR_Chr14g0693231 [Helianthus annuus]|nr:hypothetical protein HanIR_Chr14g0693231 [Helianthus annuus]